MAFEHRAPGRQGSCGAAVEAAQRPFDPGALGARRGLGLVVQQRPPGRAPGPAAAPRCGPGAAAASRAVSRTRSSAGPRRRTPCPRRTGSARGAQLLDHRDQEGLDRADRVDLADRAGRCGRTSPRPAAAAAARSASSRAARAPRPGRRRMSLRRCFQAPPAAGRALGPADPAAQLGRLRPGQGGREGAVGGVEQVVALVEDDALEGAVSLSPFSPRAARAPSKAAWVMTRAWLAMTRSARLEPRIGLLDEAGAVVEAAGVDALAAPVDQVGGRAPGPGRRRRTGSGSQAGKSPPVMSPSRRGRGPARRPAPSADQVAVAQRRGR